VAIVGVKDVVPAVSRLPILLEALPHERMVVSEWNLGLLRHVHTCRIISDSRFDTGTSHYIMLTMITGQIHISNFTPYFIV